MSGLLCYHVDGAKEGGLFWWFIWIWCLVLRKGIYVWCYEFTISIVSTTAGFCFCLRLRSSFLASSLLSCRVVATMFVLSYSVRGRFHVERVVGLDAAAMSAWFSYLSLTDGHHSRRRLSVYLTWQYITYQTLFRLLAIQY